MRTIPGIFKTSSAISLGRFQQKVCTQKQHQKAFMQGRMFFPFSSPWSRLRTTSSCMRWDVGGNFVVLIHFRGFLLLKLLRGPHHERRSITIGPALRCYCECCRSSSEGLSMDGRGTKKKNGPDRLLILTLEAVY